MRQRIIATAAVGLLTLALAVPVRADDDEKHCLYVKYTGGSTISEYHCGPVGIDGFCQDLQNAGYTVYNNTPYENKQKCQDVYKKEVEDEEGYCYLASEKRCESKKRSECGTGNTFYTGTSAQKDCQTNVTNEGGTNSSPLSVSLTGAEQLNSSDLCKVNPLCQSTVFASKRTPGDITSRLVKNVVFPIAGLLLFLYIVWGGFQVVQGATMGNDNIVASGKQRVTAAIIGFLLLFASYWMWSLVELALGLGTTKSS